MCCCCCCSFKLLTYCIVAILRDSAAVVVVCTRPGTIPLARITMRKSIHGTLLSYMGMVLRLEALRAAGALL